MTALLRLNEIVLQLGTHRVLNGLQLDVNSGEVQALLGANGAGKSTLAYMLMGSEDYQPQAGSITFAGESLRGLPSTSGRGAGSRSHGRNRRVSKD